MKATDQLKLEHEGITLSLQILERIFQRVESEERSDLENLRRILEFFKVFVDKCHHGKEEDLLFPAMLEVGISREQAQIDLLLNDHNTGRQYVRAMEDSMGNWKTGHSRDPSLLVENARNYISLLTQHIDRENNTVFPLADQYLAEKVQETLLEGFERIETERIGTGKHEEFHALLDRLRHVYLA